MRLIILLTFLALLSLACFYEQAPVRGAGSMSCDWGRYKNVCSARIILHGSCVDIDYFTLEGSWQIYKDEATCSVWLDKPELEQSPEEIRERLESADEPPPLPGHRR